MGVLGLLSACTELGDEEDTSTIVSELSVGSYTTGTCSTSVVIGLSRQIADEVGCLEPDGLVPFEPSDNLQITSNAVLPYLGADARKDLMDVAAGRVVKVNSAFRTVVQQYLLYRWYQLGRCGITAAARPGRSNHESGRALDVANYSSLVSAMANQGWSHDVPGDPVHFDHLGSPDIRGQDVLAFQRLWNRNNPGDAIAEDGLYGPQTEARLRSAPATGFELGASCGTRALGANVVMVEGPDKLAPGARARYAITVANTGTADWPATTRIVVAGGGESQLYDPEAWTSPGEVGTIGLDVPAGSQGVVEIPVLAPIVDEVTPVYSKLTLSADGAMMGQIDLAVTITPDGDEHTSADADDTHDDGGEVTGGCSAGGGSIGWLGLVLGAGMLARRRRRG